MRIRAAALAGLALVLAGAACAQTSLDIAADWRFSPDEGNVGMSEGWHARQYDDTDWATLDAGSKWEEQGFPDLDGYGWYRKWVNIPATWAGKRTWLAFGGVNDCGVLFCSGKYVTSFGDERHYSAAGTASTAEIGTCVRAGEPNLIALRIYDWGLSGGLWRLPCMLTTNAEAVPSAVDAQCIADYTEREAVLGITQTGLDRERLTGTYHIEITREGRASPVARHTIPIPRDQGAAFTTFALPAVEESVDYLVRIEGRDAEGEVIAGTRAETIAKWPGEPARPAGYEGVKVLNNLVAELLNAQCPRATESRLEFTNPRKGWVFFSIAVQGGETRESGGPELVLDGESEPLVLRTYPETRALEAMRFLTAGRHTLTVRNAAGGRLIVRAVPELAYCYYPTVVHIPEQGSYDWAFLERHILPHVNVLISPGDGPPEDRFEQWLREGRHWVNRAGLPGLHAAKPAPADEVYGYWMARVGTTNPRYRGLIIDEFSDVEPEYYREWTDALARLSDAPEFAGKTFYAWCGTMYEQEPADEFRRLIRERNHRFAWEQYLPEPPTDDAARLYVLEKYVHNMSAWKEETPDVGRYVQMCPAFFSTPPCTANSNPGVNFNVLLDRQFRTMATDPAYADLYGVMQWAAAYADEETLRWGYRLFRHYCIEGHRGLLGKDPYVLPHLKNADFADGLAHWRIEPAAEGSIAVERMIWFGRLQGRYRLTTEGDTFLRMKRDPERPNRVRQTVKDLEPGRLYSLKLISTDLKHLDVKQKVGVSLELDNVEVLDEYGYQSVFRSRPLKEVKACAGLEQVFMNYHRVVFRAKAPTAELTISDWASPTEPGGMEDQELACNFVELQPYYPTFEGLGRGREIAGGPCAGIGQRCAAQRGPRPVPISRPRLVPSACGGWAECTLAPRWADR